jgi:predicted RNA-binding protein with PIN domain
VPLLIDGHNLIGAKLFPDIRLSDEDDEAKLVARLKVWKSRYRDRITVIFDRGIPGGRDAKLGGAGVDVIFAADPTQADDLIRRRLRKPARGLILVTNDRALLQEAFMHGVTTWRGDEFVARLAVPNPPKAEPGREVMVRQSPAELAQWEAIFNARYAALQRARQRRKAAKAKLNKPAPSRRRKP